MVDRPQGPPRREGGHARGRWLQLGARVEGVHFGLVGIAVEVAHQHGVGMVAEQVGNEVDLGPPRLRAQRQVRHCHRQRVVAAAKGCQQYPAPLDPAGQCMVFHQARFQLAEQAVGAGRHATHAAVGLVAPVGEAGAFGQVMGLVGETGAQTARIGFLQADDVVPPGQDRDGVQGAAFVAGGQHVRPAAGHVVVVTAGAGSRLDIGAEQAQPADGHSGCGAAITIGRARRPGPQRARR